jgi:hypothetical protein
MSRVSDSPRLLPQNYFRFQSFQFWISPLLTKLARIPKTRNKPIVPPPFSFPDLSRPVPIPFPAVFAMLPRLAGQAIIVYHLVAHSMMHPDLCSIIPSMVEWGPQHQLIFPIFPSNDCCALILHRRVIHVHKRQLPFPDSLKLHSRLCHSWVQGVL